MDIEQQTQYTAERLKAAEEMLIRLARLIANTNPLLYPGISALTAEWNRVREEINAEYKED